jgi:hypothetical protein
VNIDKVSMDLLDQSNISKCFTTNDYRHVPSIVVAQVKALTELNKQAERIKANVIILRVLIFILIVCMILLI